MPPAELVKRLRARADEQERCNSYPLDRAMDREAADRIEALERENFALAANQCKHGVSGEHGDHVCSRIEALEKALRDCLSYVDEGWLKERIRAELEPQK